MAKTRSELFQALKMTEPVVDLDAITEQAYLLEEELAHKKNSNKSPGGRAFYSSMFPGGEDEKRCARHALYGMIGAPDPEPIKPAGRAVIEMGKAAEKQIVWRWGKMGILLGGIDVPDKEYNYMNQLGFNDPDLWLSGYADAVLDLRPRIVSVYPVDIKSKSHDHITQLRNGTKTYDPDHYKQIQSYIYLCRKYHEYLGFDKLGLEPAKSGAIFYVSRDNPRFTWTAHIEYDHKFVEAGIERLKEWKENFLNDELPERPKEWKWTKPPCQWCSLKKNCKADIKNDVTRLSDSSVVELATKLNPKYDLEKTKEAVIKRWTPKQH